MKEIKCEVIRDLLPLYEDNAVSEETQELVREHLKDCSACREELRKMRTPISLPPEEDENLWEKYVQRRAELKRKRNIKICCILTVLAAIALFCLWYVWPRDWETVTSQMPGDITNLSAALSQLHHSFDDDGKVNASFDFWIIQEEQAKGVPTGAVINAFKSSSYRKSLQSLIPRDMWHLEGTADYVQTGIIWNGAQYESISVLSDGRMLFNGDLYYTDQMLYYKLADIIQKYGVFQED